MAKPYLCVAAMAAVLGLSACQNGVIATPFGDYGVKSRDGNRVTIGFINKKTPSMGTVTKPKVVLPQDFQGQWVHTSALKDAPKACKGNYDSDDIMRLSIDANNNRMSLNFYEEGGDAHWLNMQQVNGTQIKGKISYLFEGMGDENPQPEYFDISMVLKNGGKQLAVYNWGERNETTVFVLCGRQVPWEND